MTKPLHCVSLWLDPGKVTGYAVFDHRSDTFKSGQLTFYELGDELTKLAGTLSYRLAVGYELFIVTDTGSRYSDPDYSLETIGMVKWISHRHGCNMLKPVPSSGRLLGLTGNKLQHLGWHKPGMPHANDAAAHLLTYLVTHRFMSVDLLAKLFTNEAEDGKIDQ